MRNDSQGDVCKLPSALSAEVALPLACLLAPARIHPAS